MADAKSDLDDAVADPAGGWLPPTGPLGGGTK